jgi:hypothetical protein
VGLPVFAVGRIKTPAFAESVLSEGKADVVAVCRALIADPFWVHKAAHAPAEIRPCIGCNQGCFRVPVHQPPDHLHRESGGRARGRTGRRHRTGGEPRTPGAGCGWRPGRHGSSDRRRRTRPSVTLVEATDTLGGQVNLAGWERFAPGTAGNHRVPAARTGQRLGVEVRMGERLEAAGALATDVLIVATGSTPPDQPVDTDGSVPVLSPAEILRQLRDGADHWRGRRVTVIDAVGHFPAYAPAEALAAAGARVTLLTSRLHAGSLLDNGSMINTLRRLGTAGVRVEAQRATIAVRAGAVQTRHIFTGDNETWPSDMVVAAVGNLPDDTLLDAPQATRIGDCQAPRTLLDAIREGRIAGRAA